MKTSMHVCEVCGAEHKMDHWNTIRAGSLGWFFTHAKLEDLNGTQEPVWVPAKAYCPEHNPPWVAGWRARKKARGRK